MRSVPGIARACAACAVIVMLIASFYLPSEAQTTTPQKLDWPFYGNDPGNMRYANVDQINPTNVATLQPAWILHTTVMNTNTSFESQPIVIDGVMYVSSPHGHVFALDAATGAIKWTFNPTIPPLAELAICCGQTNRGVAVGNGKVFVAQLDATLVALDANTGAVVWKVTVDRWQDKWTETMAPQFVNGKVIIGASGGEYQVRGHVRAYDADTGKMLWEFFTIPGPGEFGNDTWAGNSWITGGGPVWTTPAVDSDLNLVYITTGNAAPDLNGSEREGTNLFAASVVALDANTGQRRWHFQEIHHEIWDYDGPEPALLFTLERNGQQIPALGHTNKNGYYFILDRRDGTPLYQVTETPVPVLPAWQHPWPTQPVPATDPLIPQSVQNPPAGVVTAPIYTPPQEVPTLIQPGFETGPEWPPSAYSPRTKYVYVPAGGYQPTVYRAIPPVVNTFGSTGGAPPTGLVNYGLFVAMDTTTGKIAWQNRLPAKAYSGATVAGDIVFFGENTQFDALDAKTGATLWTFKSGQPGIGGPNGAPAVYVVNGVEYVVMAFGGNSQNGAAPGDALIAFTLPQPGQGQPATIQATVQQVPTGALPASATQPPLASPPADARVIEIDTTDTDYQPSSFTALTGEKIAIHLVNTGANGAGFIVALPTGQVGLSSSVAGGQDGYFVFTAPAQPGVFEFFGSGGAQFMGMTGLMRVGPSCTSTTGSCFTTAGVVNAATMRSGSIAPGEVLTIFGLGIGPNTAALPSLALPSGPLPTTLGDTQVLFDGVAAPLLYTQANQVNAIVPFEVGKKDSVQLAITHSGQMVGPVTLSVVASQPGIFTTKGGTIGPGIVFNQDGSLNSPSNPAVKGSTVSIFATGAGQTIPPGVNGAFAVDDSAKPALPVDVLIGGFNATPVNARTPQGMFAGVVQIDAPVPATAASGPQIPVAVAIGDVLSPNVTIAIQ